jgi:diacylglycerol kinase (ATP)
VRIALVANPASGSADEARLESVVEILRSHGDLEIIQPESAEETALLLASSDAELVIVSGGDGTLNLAVNALRERISEVTLGLVPSGTGNDLARTLEIPEDAGEAALTAITGESLEIDIWRARSAEVDRIFINACMGGFPVAVNKAITADLKRWLGPAAFWVGGTKALKDVQRYEVTVNGETFADCLAVGVGNGRTSGGGVEVWPAADPSDGSLEVCALGAAGVTEAVRLATQVKSGDHVDLPDVHCRSGAQVEIIAEPQLELNIDGELAGFKTPVTFEHFTSTHFKVPVETPG